MMIDNPSQQLAKIRRLAYLMKNSEGTTREGVRLAELIDELDEHLTWGGKLPDTWNFRDES